MNWLIKISTGDNWFMNLMFKISNWLVERQLRNL